MGPHDPMSQKVEKGHASSLIHKLVLFQKRRKKEAGIRIEPPVSDPIAAGTIPVASATPAPLDEPPVYRSLS